MVSQIRRSSENQWYESGRARVQSTDDLATADETLDLPLTLLKLF